MWYSKNLRALVGLVLTSSALVPLGRMRNPLCRRTNVKIYYFYLLTILFQYFLCVKYCVKQSAFIASLNLYISP